MVRMTLAQKMRSLALVSVGATTFFGGISFTKGNEKFFNDVLMPVNKFVQPETSHRIAVMCCKYNLFPKSPDEDPKTLKTNFLGHKLKNPIGIAAGFDKQGEAILGLYRIGFGMVEIGSVTPLPQPGNPKPRVFRLSADNAIINRYGFNSDGHDEVYKRLQSLEKANLSGLLGINLGKNKTSDDAVSDYVKGVKLFAPIADYLVVNISSPNTPGLRSLQNKDELKILLSEVLKTRNELPENQRVPILLKLSPDLTKEDVTDIAKVIQKKECHVDGLVISNTTIDKSNLSSEDMQKESGGLSGAPLTSRSTNLIAQMYSLTKGAIPIIGVGGIFSGKDAFEKIQAGASVVQIYTALIYHGPPVIEKIKRELDTLIKENGYKNVNEAVGKTYKSFLNR